LWANKASGNEKQIENCIFFLGVKLHFFLAVCVGFCFGVLFLKKKEKEKKEVSLLQ